MGEVRGTAPIGAPMQANRCRSARPNVEDRELGLVEELQPRIAEMVNLVLAKWSTAELHDVV